jgi:hypothetical protein
MNHNTKWIAILIGAGALACGETTLPATDQAGTAVVSIASSYVADGAVFITVRGPGLSAAAAANSAYTVFSRLVGPDELKVIVLGEAVAPGDLFTLPVGAINRLSGYTVRVEQVATQDDSLRSDLSQYRASLTSH